MYIVHVCRMVAALEQSQKFYETYFGDQSPISPPQHRAMDYFLSDLSDLVGQVKEHVAQHGLPCAAGCGSQRMIL